MQSRAEFSESHKQAKYLISSEDMDGDMSPVEEFAHADDEYITHHEMDGLVKEGDISIFKLQKGWGR